jgi:quercetin dioxygenase-like cupin family protein
MRLMRHGAGFCLVVLAGVVVLSSCVRNAPPPEPEVATQTLVAETPHTPLILAAGEGERRVWRHVGVPFYLKIDRRNGGSPELVMGYEDIPPGVTIPPHRHLGADEIIFVHRGRGLASVGQLQKPVEAGATVYIPRGSRISLQNTGTEPLTIAFVFSRPGFEELMRDASAADGEPVKALGAEELTRILEKHRGHTVYEAP